jgi:hypothetical protein
MASLLTKWMIRSTTCASQLILIQRQTASSSDLNNASPTFRAGFREFNIGCSSSVLLIRASTLQSAESHLRFFQLKWYHPVLDFFFNVIFIVYGYTANRYAPYLHRLYFGNRCYGAGTTQPGNLLITIYWLPAWP